MSKFAFSSNSPHKLQKILNLSKFTRLPIFKGFLRGYFALIDSSNNKLTLRSHNSTVTDTKYHTFDFNYNFPGQGSMSNNFFVSYEHSIKF